mmetsp:Transcript_7249/g.12253  ORF Transcript_7249/g.12253 Transcript_7249/m.12253 type:complete len:238 (-) Transcript_7249:303-1016(-)
MHVCSAFAAMLHASWRRPLLLRSYRVSHPSMAISWQRVADEQGVTFLGGFPEPKEMPKFAKLPEITLAGRSNVGKSSALNLLSGRRKKIATVSKTPGRTRLINLFQVGKVCTITDLPGYGYAKVSKDMQDQWKKSIERYLGQRESLRLVVLFVDAQRDPQEADAQLLDFLTFNGLPAVVVATKVDKLRKNDVEERLRLLQDRLDLPRDQPIALSCTSGLGRRELWQYMQNTCSQPGV